MLPTSQILLKWLSGNAPFRNIIMQTKNDKSAFNPQFVELLVIRGNNDLDRLTLRPLYSLSYFISSFLID